MGRTVQKWVMEDGELKLKEVPVPSPDDVKVVPTSRIARNDSDNDLGETCNLLNRRWDLPIVDAHCHVMGQSLLGGREQDPNSDPRWVTFIKAGTNGSVKKQFRPSVLLIKKKKGSSGNDPLAMLAAARNSPAGEATVAALKATLELVEAALRQAASMAADARAALDEVYDAILAACREAMHAVVREAGNASKAIVDALKSARKSLTNTWDSVKGGISAIAGSLVPQIDSLISRLASSIDTLAEKISSTVESARDDMLAAVKRAVDEMKQAWNNALSAIESALTKASELRDRLSEWIDDQTDALQNRVESLIEDVERQVSRAVEAIDKANERARKAMSELADRVDELAGRGSEEIARIIKPIVETSEQIGAKIGDVSRVVGDASDKASEAARNAYNLAKGELNELTERCRKMSESLRASMQDYIDKIREEADDAREKMDKAIDEIKSKLQSAKNKLEEVVSTARSVLDTAKKTAQMAADVVGTEAQRIASAAADLGQLKSPGKLDKVFGGGVVEMPAADWPPAATTKKIGNRVFPAVEVSDGTTVKTYGIASGGPAIKGGAWLIDEMSQPMLRFVGYFLGREEHNARVAIGGMPRMGGRVIIPYLLDMGYTPLSMPVPLIGTFATMLLGLPDPKGDDDGYYKKDDEYLWFDRNGFNKTIDAQKKAVEEYPYQVWPMVPFDPRRPGALDTVKAAIKDKMHVGVKLYTRCGWMPTGNKELYGPKGFALDSRLNDLYSWCESEDIPLVNHTSPTGYPPDAVLTLPALYESGTMYHNRMMFPGRVGAGPLPLGILDFVPPEVKDLVNGVPNPSPDELRLQAKALQSESLDQLGTLADKAKEHGLGFYDQLSGCIAKAKQEGGQAADKLAALFSPSNIMNPQKHAEIGKYIDPARLQELTKQCDPGEVVRTIAQFKDGDQRSIRDLIDPSKIEDTADKAKAAGKAVEGKIRNPLDTLFDIACKLLAMLACYRAANHNHYIQHTVSPYAWEEVLKKHPKLRLNFAHCCGDAAVASHYDLDLSEEEAKETGDDEKIRHAKLLKNIVEVLHEVPCVASGEKFKTRLFAHCARKHVGPILFQWAGTGEDAIDPAKQAADLVSQVLQQILPAVFGRILRKYNLTQLRDQTRASVQWVLDTDPWKEWLDDWEKEYPAGWHEKMLELIDRYDNTYTDLAYLSGDSTEAFRLLMRKIALDAYPDEAALDPSWSGLMIKEGKEIKEGVLADRCMMGTDWYMTERDDLTSEAFWGRMQSVVGDEHPLWDRWASGNALKWINLGPRMDDLEELYKKSRNAPKSRPKWWTALRHYYELED